MEEYDGRSALVSMMLAMAFLTNTNLLKWDELDATGNDGQLR
jgi:hypothetical protein